MTTLINNADKAVAQFYFAHGAGAGQDSEFMQQVAERLAALGIRVHRFNFPYMQVAEQTGKKRPPDRNDKLQVFFQDLLSQADKDLPLFIGGKSMGGRIATQILDSSPALGAVVFGYPFHPPGKPDKLRTEHLQNLSKPLLVLQGERDTFGRQDEVEQYALSEQVQCKFLPDGDHSLKPRKASGMTQDEHIASAAHQAANFIKAAL